MSKKEKKEELNRFGEAEGEKGAGVKRDGRARMLEAQRPKETGSVFSDQDDMTP